MFKKYKNHISIGIGIVGIAIAIFRVQVPNDKVYIVVIGMLCVLVFVMLFVLIKKWLTDYAKIILQQNKAFCMQGKLFYEKESAVIRRKTLQCIFDYLIEKSKDNCQQTLPKLGEIVAKDLISSGDLKENIKLICESKSKKDVILKWGSVETDCNWGKFEITFEDLNNGKFRGNIKVQKNVLSYDRKDRESFCLYFIKYFELIISELAEFAVIVEEISCGKKFEDGTCIFSFEPKQE